MYVKAAIYKVQALAFIAGAWVDIGVEGSMSTCKAARAFLEGADEPITTRTVYVRSTDATAVR
jgi:hypothetical protein